jgi:GGDEF domain-containing protein
LAVRTMEEEAVLHAVTAEVDHGSARAVMPAPSNPGHLHYLRPQLLRDLVKEEVNRLTECVRSYRTNLHNRFIRLLEPIAANFWPPKAKAYLDSLDKLYSSLERCSQQRGDEGPFEVSDQFASALRDAVIWTRLRVAQSVEERRTLTIDPDLLRTLDADLEPYTALLNAPWFQRAEPRLVPQLTEFFPVQRVEAELAREHGQPRAREFDEKCRILQAPSLFLHDLDRGRSAAALRGVHVGVAYLDIDHFKAFNDERGNSHVDRHMLPTFMRRVEARVFTRAMRTGTAATSTCSSSSPTSPRTSLWCPWTGCGRTSLSCPMKGYRGRRPSLSVS